MEVSLKRPEEPVAAVGGLMRREQFQTAYVTNDLDKACTLLGERFGIENFSFMEGAMAEGGSIRVAFAWVGGTMYEIIDAKGGEEAEFYTSRLPAEGFGLVFHHLGFFIHSRDEWNDLKAEVEERGMAVAMLLEDSGFIDAIYVEAPELGHYLEYVFPEEAGLDFFAAVPVNGA